MGAHEVRLIDSADRKKFQAKLQSQLEAVNDEVTVDPESIQISLAVGPGPHFAALISWQYEPEHVQFGSQKGVTQEPIPQSRSASW